MYKSFQIINDFIKDIYGFDFIRQPMHRRITEIEELKNAYDTIMNIIRSQREPLSSEFVYYVYPLFEVAFQWTELKKKGKLTEKFLKRCKPKFVALHGNFYGAVFEIDMALRCLLSGWSLEFVEDYIEEGKRIDFVFRNSVGVECTSKRYSEKTLTIDKINETITEKAEKFMPEYIAKLRIPLDEKLVVTDITTEDYSPPKILNDLERTIVSSPLDAVIFTWREDIVDGGNHSLRANYKTFGNIDREYFSTTYAAEFHITNKGPVFFEVKYVEPEPTWGEFGAEESLEDYY